MRLLPLALGVLWPAIAIAGASEEELVATIVHTPRWDEAEPAVRELIRDLHEQGRIVELRAWVERLADDPVVTFRRPELAQMLRRLQLEFLRNDAELAEREARRASAPASYEHCVDGYAALRSRLESAADLRDDYWQGAQLAQARYNEAVCAEHAGHPIHALALYAQVTGSLGGLAQARFARLLGALPQIGYARATGEPLSKIEMPRKIFEYDFPDDNVID